jgi:hypothetical protein
MERENVQIMMLVTVVNEVKYPARCGAEAEVVNVASGFGTPHIWLVMLDGTGDVLTGVDPSDIEPARLSAVGPAAG